MTQYAPALGKPDEASLVRRVLTRDLEAFTPLVDAYQGPVFGLCYRLLGDAAEAEEAAQETFLRAYLHLRDYDQQRPLKTWLFAIAHHHCIDRLRRRHGVSVAWEDDPPLPSLAGEPPHTLEAAVLQRERNRLIQRLLTQLPPLDRAAVVMRYWLAMSYVEIAQATGATESAVKSRLHRARTALARSMLADGLAA